MLQLQQYQQLILPVLKRHMVKHAAIFGSVAKGDTHPNSDIDLLIEPAKDFTIFKMLMLEEEIATLLKCKVDLVEYSALKASIKDEVMRSAITIY
jgi:predicted nucleotidyltransferase